MLNARMAVLAVALVAAAGSASATFVMKKEAERDARAIGELNRKIAAERQRISELRAEWSALDHPARLQALVERHAAALDLAPIRAEQVVSVAEAASAARRRAEDEAAATTTAEGTVE